MKYSAMACFLLLAPSLQADTATWSSPTLDTWTYPSAGSPGQRTLGPTFITNPGVDEFDQFLPSSGRDPARRGMTIAAFDTSSNIDTGLDTARYAINSVTVEFTMQFGTAGDVLYDDTPETNAELLADYLSGDIDTARPMELYGVGFQAGFTGFDFAQTPGTQAFGEDTYPYSPSDSTGVLATYPIASDAQGAPVDVSNSLTGGYSATAPGNDTAPFDATPWSIGTAAGLTAGDVIPADTTFSFSLDLNLPGVVEYVQQSLTEGALGFVLSSQHFTGDPHNGQIVPYPQWYLKEFPTNYGGVPSTLAVGYTILPLAGDYDQDGDVDSDDYTEWVAAYGTSVGVAGEGADGNADGIIDAADYTVWRDNYSNTPAPVAVSVPEPTSVTCLFLGLIAFCCLGRRVKLVSQHESNLQKL